MAYSKVLEHEILKATTGYPNLGCFLCGISLEHAQLFKFWKSHYGYIDVKVCCLDCSKKLEKMKKKGHVIEKRLLICPPIIKS